MLEFINSNPLLVWGFGIVVVFVMMFVLVKPKSSKKNSKAKNSKKESGEKEKKSDMSNQQKEKLDKPENLKEETQSEEVSTKIYKKKKVKKSKSKPEVRPVFEKKETKQQKEEVQTNDSLNDDLSNRAQFINTSKKISKFAGFSSMEEKLSEQVENLTHEQIEDLLESGDIEIDKNCEVCKDFSRHFDHSRRLSKIIEEDAFDSMFMSHLTDHYLNINAEKHLKDVDKNLFDRTAQTMDMADRKLTASEESVSASNDRSSMREWLEDRKRETLASYIVENDENENSGAGETPVMDRDRITARSLIVSDAVSKRVGGKNKKR